jgi:hypothetical protein
VSRSEPELHPQPIPEGAALFHIGSPKTATSAVQYSANAKRAALLAKGVLYPEPRSGARSPHRHRDAVNSLRSYGEREARTPETWDELLRARAAHPTARVLISDEWASTLPARAIAYARDSLGPGSQIVYSVRNYGDFLLSLWQEDLRSGKVDAPLEAWLRKLDFARRRRPSRGRIPIERQADRLQRWVDAFGPERVNVVVVDKATPGLVFEFFASLLGLVPADLEPRSDEERGPAGNRGLTAVEADFVQRVVVASEATGMPEELRRQVLNRGAFKRLQHRRTPPADERRLAIPASVADEVARFAQDQWAVIDGLGVRVIGDPAEFSRYPVLAPEEPPTAVPIDAAIESILGILEATSGAPAERSVSRKR